MPAQRKVSVLMAVHNGMPYLRSAVNSILEQARDDFEFLIIDDGSTDQSFQYLSSIHDDRLRLIQVDHGGLTLALNTGLQAATGEYVARQDADDISHPDRLGGQIAYLDENPGVAVVGSWYKVIDDSGLEIFDRRLPRGQAIVDTLHLAQSPLAHGSVMMRRDVVESVGGYRNEFHYAQDLDLWLRIADQHRIENLPEFLYSWRLPKTGSSATKRFQQRRYAAMALQCSKARAAGDPEPLDQVEAIRTQTPGPLWRLGYLAKACIRGIAGKIGKDVSPPTLGE